MPVVVEKLDQDDVEQALEEISALEGSAEVTLELSGDGDTGIEGIALIGSTLLGLPQPLSLEVKDECLVKAFAELGLASAVSRAPRERTVAPPELSGERWANTWTPASRAGSAMFGTDPTSPKDQFGPHFATFNDPHLTAPQNGSGSLTMLIRRWIWHKLELAKLELAETQILDRAGFFLDELLGNVQEHAVTDDAPPIRSQLQVAWRHVDGEHLLTIAVFDTGPGVYDTLTKKLGDDAPTDEIELLTNLLQGTLSPWSRARGIGLSRCFELIGESDSARMLLATGEARCYGQHDGDLQVKQMARVTGTIAAITLPV